MASCRDCSCDLASCRDARQEAESHGQSLQNISAGRQSLQEAVYRAQQSRQEARDRGQSRWKPNMTDSLCRKRKLADSFIPYVHDMFVLVLLLESIILNIPRKCNGHKGQSIKDTKRTKGRNANNERQNRLIRPFGDQLVVFFFFLVVVWCCLTV